MLELGRRSNERSRVEALLLNLNEAIVEVQKCPRTVYQTAIVL